MRGDGPSTHLQRKGEGGAGLAGLTQAAATANGARPGLDRLRIGLLGLCLILVVSLAAPAAVAQSGPIGGQETIEDPYFPRLGNAGYDVRHYHIALRIDPKRRFMTGETTIELETTADLRSFSFDFVGFDVTGVTVDGRRAEYSQTDRKVRIGPEQPLAARRRATVQVAYEGNATNPSRNLGWLWFPGGGALFSTQPAGARTVFPCNDHPSDKATFSYELTTPRGFTSVANGLPRSRQDAGGGWERVVWSEPESFPTYAALVAVGDFELVRTQGPGGLPILNALPTKHAERLERRLRNQGKIVRVLERVLGPYPYGSIGAIVTPRSNPDAMEAATRPTYPGVRWALRGDDFEQIVAHEIAHMWLGNTVTNATWQDIWLNEGFATYGELIWLAHKHRVPIGMLFERDSDVFAYTPSMQRVPPGDPGPGRIFDISVYNRGAMTLEALRRTVGDRTFNRILRAWVSRYGGGNASTEDFIRLAEKISGRNLDPFFQRWLYKRGVPPLPKDRSAASLNDREIADILERLRDIPPVRPHKTLDLDAWDLGATQLPGDANDGADNEAAPRDRSGPGDRRRDQRRRAAPAAIAWRG